jgi:hypothetical protein
VDDDQLDHRHAELHRLWYRQRSSQLDRRDTRPRRYRPGCALRLERARDARLRRSGARAPVRRGLPVHAVASRLQRDLVHGGVRGRARGRRFRCLLPAQHALKRPAAGACGISGGVHQRLLLGRREPPRSRAGPRRNRGPRAAAGVGAGDGRRPTAHVTLERSAVRARVRCCAPACSSSSFRSPSPSVTPRT